MLQQQFKMSVFNTIAISIDNAGTYANGYKIGEQASTFQVTSAKLTVNVDPDTQKQKAGSSRKDLLSL